MEGGERITSELKHQKNVEKFVLSLKGTGFTYLRRLVYTELFSELQRVWSLKELMYGNTDRRTMETCFSPQSLGGAGGGEGRRQVEEMQQAIQKNVGS